MDLVVILHVLWQRRTVVAVGVVVAVAAGMAAGRSATTAGRATGVASVRVLLDTSDSQLVEAAPKQADTLGMRAGLLADSLGSDAGRATLAREAGVPQGKLSVLGPAARNVPPVETPLVKQLGAAALAPGTPYVVDVVADGQSPIISVSAYAPDVQRAAKLAAAAVAGLRLLLVADDASRSRGFVLDTVTPLRSYETLSASRRHLIMLLAAVVTFGLWCGCVIVGVGLSWRLRRGGALEIADPQL